MELTKKLKFARSLKDWTQEDIAEKLGISVQAYAKIERGETDVNLSRLQQTADVMEIDLPQLLGFNEKNIFAGTHNTQGDNWYVNSSATELIECKYKLEKANLIIKEGEKEINYLKQQVEDLRKMVEFLKK